MLSPLRQLALWNCCPAERSAIPIAHASVGVAVVLLSPQGRACRVAPGLLPLGMIWLVAPRAPRGRLPPRRGRIAPDYRFDLPPPLELRSVTTGTRPRGDRRGLRARQRCWTNVVDMRQSSRSRPNQAHASVAHSCPSASRSAGSGPHCRRTCTWGPGSHGSARGHDHGDASGRPRNSPLASDEQAVRFDCALPGFTPHVVVWNPARKVD